MKNFITRLAATAVAVVSLTAAAQAFDPGATECIAPANPGGGWDFTCRQVGKTLQDLKLVDGTMQVTNMAGGGGGVAYAEVINKRNDANNLIIAASSATSTRLAQGAYPGNTLSNVGSGIGNEHNTCLLDRFEKPILKGRLVDFPKRIWFSSHARSMDVAPRLLGFYHRPALWKIPALFATALRG